MSKRGLVVGLLEDDQDMAALVAQWLDEAGYAVRLFRNATEYRRRQGSEAVDLLLLDWMLPDGSGIEVIESIRSSPNGSLPVVFLTARDSEDDIVRGLASGGDDYVVKPPKQRELIARVNAVLRRHGVDADGADTVDVAPYAVDAKRRRVSLSGQDIDLTQRETKNFSHHFARTAVSELKTAAKLHKHPLKSAGFKVLKAPDVPSVLVELGYVSNKQDLKLMVSEAWRTKTSDALAQAVTTFFSTRLAGSGPRRGAD